MNKPLIPIWCEWSFLVTNTNKGGIDIVIYNKDCITGSGELEEESVDLVIVDPSYNLGFGGTNFNKISNPSSV